VQDIPLPWSFYDLPEGRLRGFRRPFWLEFVGPRRNGPPIYFSFSCCSRELAFLSMASIPQPEVFYYPPPLVYTLPHLSHPASRSPFFFLPYPSPSSNRPSFPLSGIPPPVGPFLIYLPPSFCSNDNWRTPVFCLLIQWLFLTCPSGGVSFCTLADILSLRLLPHSPPSELLPDPATRNISCSVQAIGSPPCPFVLGFCVSDFTSFD